MSSPARIEPVDERYSGLDLWATRAVGAAVLASQQQALERLASRMHAFEPVVDVLSGLLAAGGRMAYAGAGSSGLVAQMDALELPGTYGIAPDRVPVILAGGLDAFEALSAGVEDDTDAGIAAVDRLALGPADGLIAVAASGSTPFTVAVLRRARARGATVVGIAAVAGSPLLDEAHHPILLDTPAEVVAGSTRMAAGTAQKCALNMLSTAVAVRLGHAYAGLMVNMRADNAKLRARASAIVARAAGVEAGVADAALGAAGGSIKVAIVACRAGVDAAEARARLEASGGHIRAALGERPAAT